MRDSVRNPYVHSVDELVKHNVNGLIADSPEEISTGLHVRRLELCADVCSVCSRHSLLDSLSRSSSACARAFRRLDSHSEPGTRSGSESCGRSSVLDARAAQLLNCRWASHDRPLLSGVFGRLQAVHQMEEIKHLSTTDFLSTVIASSQAPTSSLTR